MNIIVLAGGLSMEREVSLSSGSRICAALRSLGHKAVVLDSFLGRQESLPENIEDFFRLSKDPELFHVRENAPDIAAIRAMRSENALGALGPNVLELCRAADIVFMGLHGADGENGHMQSLFDMAGICYTGSGYLGSALAMNKWVAKQLFFQNGVLTPRAQLLRANSAAARALSFPCVIKPCSGGSSVGVSIVRDETELKKALDGAFLCEDDVLAEEFIEGREFSVGVLDGKALPPIEIIPNGGFYDYAHKYQSGRTMEICPADITPDEDAALRNTACRAYEALRLGVYARMDFMLDGTGRAYCLEANTLPGMTPTSLIPQEAAAAGIGYERLCGMIVELSLKKAVRR